MRILAISQYYHPEPFRVKDICENLVNLGHDVTVVCEVPSYPEGKVYNDFRMGKNRKENINGVEVCRVNTIARRKNPLFRFLNYFSYSFFSTRFVKKKLKKKFDVVFVNQLSPVTMGIAAYKLKKKYNIPIVVYCMDLWPESLVVGGVKRSSLLYKLFYRISKKVYTSADKLLVTSKQFLEYLSGEFNIPKELTDYLPQSAESVYDFLEYEEHSDKLNLVFAGNIGVLQSVETIIEAAVLLKNEKVEFNIVGGGSELDNLMNLASEKKADNVIFRGRCSIEEMPSIYKRADALLVTMRANPVISLTIPGKVQSYMAVGRPIIGAIDGETKNVIAEAECGFCGKADDAKELAENVRRFIASNNKKQMGLNARKYYEEHFTEEMFMKKLENELKMVQGINNENTGIQCSC